MQVKFLNMEREAQQLVENGLMQELEQVILSGRYLFGDKSKQLEEKLSEVLNANVVMVGSGTDALYLSLKAFGIGVGDTVAIPTISAIPTAIAVKMTGANIEYVEVNSETLLMDIENLRSKDNISAIIPVHLYGNVFNIYDILTEYSKSNIPIIEDCAQAYGSKFGLDYVGTLGNIGCFSLYPTKNLGCYGDAGFIATLDITLAEEIRELRFYGQKNSYSMGQKIGMNSRIDEIQSTILLKKLEHMDEMFEKRREMLKTYGGKIGFGIKWSSQCMPHLFPIMVPNRSKFRRLMKEKGVDTATHYPFVLPQAIEKTNKRYAISENIANMIVSIPFNPFMTDEEIQYVIGNTSECLWKICNGR